jgi:hypothetical protein
MRFLQRTKKTIDKKMAAPFMNGMKNTRVFLIAIFDPKTHSPFLKTDFKIKCLLHLRTTLCGSFNLSYLCTLE